MSEHRAIWLEPSCVTNSGEDRHWCQDDTWGACEECGTKSVKYIIATEHDALVKALEDIKAATLNGSVCPDVAWFGPGETLHDFCERILDHVGSPKQQEGS